MEATKATHREALAPLDRRPGAGEPAMVRALAGAVLAALFVVAVAPHCIGWFEVPTGGVGKVTIEKYPKQFDYFVVAALAVAGSVGALALGARLRPSAPEEQTTSRRPAVTLVAALAVFATMCIIHDHPYASLDMYHEGEHLAVASVLLDGGRPYGETFFIHGFATDGGLDALVLGSEPSPVTSRRMQTLLNAAALALLVPIAAEVTATTAGLIAALVVSLAAFGAGEVPVFPYFRWIPLLIAVWALLRYQRHREDCLRTATSASGGSDAAAPRAPEPASTLLFVAAIASSLGLLWSLEVGMYAVAASVIVILVHTRRVTWIALAAVAAPLAILLATRSDIEHFVRDSFVIIPQAIDAVWAKPAKPIPSFSLLLHPIALWEWLASEPARYYVPPVVFGFLLALSLRRRDMRIATVAIFSTLLFRSAAGRCDVSHTRFAIPLLGIAVVAFLLEPWFRGRPMNLRRGIALLVATAIGFQYFGIATNAAAGVRLLAGWPARLRHDGLVPHPMPRGRGLYVTPENAADLAALRDLNQRAGGGTMFDFTGERALYYFLDRRPATRCPDIAMLSAPELSAEALRELNAHPPRFVVLQHGPELGSLGGVGNRERVPSIAAWIDAHYPVRVQAGSYVVAFRK